MNSPGKSGCTEPKSGNKKTEKKRTETKFERNKL